MIVKDYNKKYNGLIDILKFIFSGLIVFSHGIFLANDGEKLILNTLTDRWNIYKWADDEKHTKSIANCL